MTFSNLRNTALLLLYIITTGCSGDATSNYTRETTFKSEEQVVAGLVYGYTGKNLLAVTGEKAVARQLFTSPESGQYALDSYSAEPAKEHIFHASFSDGSSLHSVWSGVPTATADVTVTFEQLGRVNPSNVNVSPDNFEARANINPITDIAYWYWLYEGQQSPYYYYLTSVFLFFKARYYIPEQNAVHDYPSPELLRLFAEIRIEPSENTPGFSIISNATGNTLCTATFAQFPICN